MEKTFEDFLMEKHADQYIGTKDCMVDNFSEWLIDLDIDDWLNYGDKFFESSVKEIVDVYEKYGDKEILNAIEWRELFIAIKTVSERINNGK